MVGISVLSSGCDAPPEEERLVEKPLSSLPGWAEAPVDGVRLALMRSCERIQEAPESRLSQLARLPEAVCHKVRELQDAEDATFKKFLADNFVAVPQVSAPNIPEMMTGYYQPLLRAQYVRDTRYCYPIYARPRSLIVIENLGRFRPELKGIRIAGTAMGGTLVPYLAREDIESRARYEKYLPDARIIAYTDDRVGLFFAHIQGSVVLEFQDRSRLRLSYDGTNGYPYTSIGQLLVAQGKLEQESVTMQSIRSYLADCDSAELDSVLHQNTSYVFFKETGDLKPIGAAQVPLTDGASAAVDPDHIPLHSLIWAEVSHLGSDKRARGMLLVAQDVGGAIKGPNRADLFCGSGAAAGDQAGIMKHPLKLYTLRYKPQ